MKKSELQQIIKEEIANVLNEQDPLQTAFDKKVGIKEPSGVQNVMRSKEWMEGKRAYLKGEPFNKQPKNPYTGKKAEQWTLGMNAALKLDPKPHDVDSKMNVSDYYKEKGSGGYTGD